MTLLGIITSPPKTTYLGRLPRPARLDRGPGLLPPPHFFGLRAGSARPPPTPLWCAEPHPFLYTGTFKHQIRRWGTAPLTRSLSYLSFSSRRFRALDQNVTDPPVLRIHDNLVWIRIRIRGSMPLTNGSRSGCGCGSGSGSIPLTNGSTSGSRRPKNTWIRIPIRIRNAGIHNTMLIWIQLQWELSSILRHTIEKNGF